jgi:hypothetical protein
MDSDRFDRWTKLFARRMSRRAAAGALGAMTAAALAQDAVLAETCEPVTRCKIDNVAWCEDVGPIPGGPYPQTWVWLPLPGCTLDGHPNELCYDAFSECRTALGGCVPGIDGWAPGCH